MKVRLNPHNFNDLPLWTAAREQDLRRLPPGARRVANQFGLDAATARLLATSSPASMTEDGMTDTAPTLSTDALLDDAEGSGLDDRTLRWLLRQETPIEAIASPLAIRSTRAHFDP